MSRFIRTACAIAVAAQFEAQVLTPVSAMCGCGGEDTTVGDDTGNKDDDKEKAELAKTTTDGENPEKKAADDDSKAAEEADKREKDATAAATKALADAEKKQKKKTPEKEAANATAKREKDVAKALADAKPSDSTDELSEEEQEELRNEAAKKNKEAEEARLAAEKAAEEKAALQKELSELHSLRPHKSAAENAADIPALREENAALRLQLLKIEELEAKLETLNSQEKQEEKKLAKIRAEAAEAYAAARKAGVQDSAEVKQLKKEAKAKVQEKMNEENEGIAVPFVPEQFMDAVLNATDLLSEEQLQRYMKSVEDKDGKEPDADIMEVIVFGPVMSMLESMIISCTEKTELIEVLKGEPFTMREEVFQKFASKDLAQMQKFFLKSMKFGRMSEHASPEELNEEIMKINDKDEIITLMEAKAFGLGLSHEKMLRLAGVLSLDEIKSVLTCEVLRTKYLLQLIKKKVMACEKKNELIEMAKELHLFGEEDPKEFESMSLKKLQAIIVEQVSPSRREFPAGGVHMSHAMPAQGATAQLEHAAIGEWDGCAPASQHSDHAVDAQGECRIAHAEAVRSPRLRGNQGAIVCEAN